eukprot:scaffold7099_cov281-Pinguiococcus_pyrenoidosus.AAC.21
MSQVRSHEAKRNPSAQRQQSYCETSHQAVSCAQKQRETAESVSLFHPDTCTTTTLAPSTPLPAAIWYDLPIEGEAFGCGSRAAEV